MSVKPLVRWAILQKWSLRYTTRGDEIVTGIFNTPAGSVPFRYEQETRIIYLPARTVHLDEHGWEIDPSGRTTFHSTRSDHMRSQHTKDTVDDET